MEPSTHEQDVNARNMETDMKDMERAGIALEKAGKFRNGAFGSAIGGMLLAGAMAYFGDAQAWRIGSLVRIASVVLAVVLFIRANGHEIAAGRLLKGRKPLDQEPDFGVFNWLVRPK